MLALKTRSVAAIATSAAAALLLAAPLAMAGGGAMKLEGAYVARVQGGGLAQWSYVLSPDASGRRASIHGSIDVGLIVPVPSDHTSPLIGEAVATGPDTVKFYSVWYGIGKTAGGVPYVAYIGTNTGEMKWSGNGEYVGTHHFAFYLPTADADGDGFPDPGATPLPLPIPVITTIDTRLAFPQ